jgi:SAM-dependent methyltransferase
MEVMAGKNGESISLTYIEALLKHRDVNFFTASDDAKIGLRIPMSLRRTGSSAPHPLAFPDPHGSPQMAVWDGRVFRIGERETRILSYDIGKSGWTDELTTFHEETAGDDHYIDRASRLHASSQLGRWLTAVSPLLVDIGCSSGLMLQVLQERFPDAAILGADYVRGPLESLAAKLPGVPLLQFDLTRCPLPGSSVDGVVLLNVLEHIERDDAALAHVSRILKPGGVAVIEVPAGPGLYDVYDKLLFHHRRYRMKDLLKIAASCGLEVLEKSHLGFFLYPGFWAVKKRGQRYLRDTEAHQREVVSRNITRAGSHTAMHKVMELEAALRKWVYYPFGIRCLVTCRKPPISAGA